MDYKFTGSTKSLLPISRAIPLQESIGQESQSTSLSHYIHIGAAPTNLIALPDQDNTLYLEHHQFKYGTKTTTWIHKLHVVFTTGGVPSSATCTFLPSVDNHYNMGGQGSNVVIGNLDKMATPWQLSWQ